VPRLDRLPQLNRNNLLMLPVQVNDTTPFTVPAKPLTACRIAIVTTAGRHEFELVNSALGYRARQVVTVKPGEVISLNVRRPEGRLSVNAVPWADVWIDGNHIGETPLANLAIGIGQHDVAFRHPTLGEQRRTTVVRFDVPTRLSADLR